MQHFIDVVDVSSSDDEGGVGTTKAPPRLPEPIFSQPTQQRGQDLKLNSNEGNQINQSRSFWKAGDFDVAAFSESTTLQAGHLEHARVHPKFLHTNATSHKWAFGAIAELLDNAVDEICNGATFVKVDRIYNVKDNSPALLFHDDGGGMDTEGLRKCMSLGYSSKKSKSTIGQYGNGFKTSTMRLGADAIVFSRATRPGRATQSIGLLSYTFLRTTRKDDVIVPMIDFDISGQWVEPIIYSSRNDWSSNLKTILEWSPFSSKEELMMQFDDMGQHGTKVIISNLWLNDEGIFELSFDDDEEDIRLRGESNQSNKMKRIQSHLSNRLRYSLRAYVSILYLRKFTNFHIILRGKPVRWLNIVDELKFPKVVVYKPQIASASKEAHVEVTLGFDAEVTLSGFNVYNRNRLIRPFWRVISDGNVCTSVFGVLEANFIEPAHDKQDFERSSMFLRLENKLKNLQMEFWKTCGHLVGFSTPQSRVSRVQKEENNPIAEQPLVGLVASSSEPDIIGPEINESDPIDVELTEQRPLIGSNFASGACSSGTPSMDICEENIQLWMRCEKQLQKKNELKMLVEKLDKEVEEAKTNCAQLSCLVQQRKNQHNTVSKNQWNGK